MKSQNYLMPVATVLVTAASVLPNAALAQQTNNASNLTNQAAPSASAVTTGGTNINYQTNNTYQNEVGFGPGVFCRTPTFMSAETWGGMSWMHSIRSQRVATLQKTMPLMQVLFIHLAHQQLRLVKLSPIQLHVIEKFQRNYQ